MRFLALWGSGRSRRSGSRGLAGLAVDRLAEQVEIFNASQGDYVVVGTHKGNYSETLNAGIAAFRAGEQPHILMVFEVGTATMMAASGAIKPVYEVMAEGDAPFDPDAYMGAVKGYYTTTEGDMLSLPYNSSTPVLYVNRDAFSGSRAGPGYGPVHLGKRRWRA